MKLLQFESTKAVPSAVGYAKPQFRKDSSLPKDWFEWLGSWETHGKAAGLVFDVFSILLPSNWGKKPPAEAMGDSQVTGAKSSGVQSSS